MLELPHTFAICINRRLGGDKPSCAARGSEAIADALEAGIRERGISVKIERLVCFGLCAAGPNGRLIPGGAFHKGLKPDDVPSLLDELARVCGTGNGTEPESGEIIPIPGC